MSRKIIFIGGMPTAGKSTIAEAVSKELNLPWISTDQIRDTLRGVVKRSELPKLFNPEGFDGEKFLTHFSATEIAQMEFSQSEAVWPGIKAFIDSDYTWVNGLIIEGVNILPKLVHKDFADMKNVKAIFVNDNNKDRIHATIHRRGLWDAADKYPDYVKEKEIEWVLEFSKILKQQAYKFNYPWLELEKNENDINSLFKIIKEN